MPKAGVSRAHTRAGSAWALLLLLLQRSAAGRGGGASAAPCSSKVTPASLVSAHRGQACLWVHSTGKRGQEGCPGWGFWKELTTSLALHTPAHTLSPYTSALLAEVPSRNSSQACVLFTRCARAHTQGMFREPAHTPPFSP